MTPVYSFEQGTTPLLISMPHTGTAIPPAIAARMTEAGRTVPDTDWHIDRLYAFARDLGASILCPHYSRYVVDLNRAPDGTALYPGQRETGLCPMSTFDGDDIYQSGEMPTRDDIAERLESYWWPYHDRLRLALAELRAHHGRALLWEAHSIRRSIPALFEGALPDVNLGTGGGTACPAPVAARLLAVARATPGFSAVLDGRFQGGYITRHYGQPAEGILAVQLELVQACYLDDAAPEQWDAARAAPAQALIRALLAAYMG